MASLYRLIIKKPESASEVSDKLANSSVAEVSDTDVQGEIWYYGLMKIMSQSSDELVLKEGGASGMVFGMMFAIIGALVGYFARASSPYAIWIGLGFAIVGLVAIFMSSSITVDIQKSAGQLAYQKKRLIGGSSASYAITDVLRIETRKQWKVERAGASNEERMSMSRQVLVSQSVVVFKDGKELPLDHQKQSSSMGIGSAVLIGGERTEVALANQIANFLGVPFQEIASPNGGIGINIGGGGMQL